MRENGHLDGLRDKRAALVHLLEPLEAGRLASGHPPVDEARMHFLRREIADLDALIAREDGALH
jgi:hypothetical protein